MFVFEHPCFVLSKLSTAINAVFCVQDTVTGFLLAGVGNVDLRKKTNFLVVNESELLILSYVALRALHSSLYTQCVALPFLIGMNYVLPAETSVKKIEDSFKEYTNRDDIAIVLINQYIADMIRHQVANYMKVAQPFPLLLTLLEFSCSLDYALANLQRCI